MGTVRDVDFDKLVFIDETGSNAAMAPLYGRGFKGDRVRGRRPRNDTRRTLTVIGALTAQGLEAVMTITGGTSTVVFLAFVQEVLAKVLVPGQVVIMDNLAAHKAEVIRRAIEACGAAVWFLPPYSPQFNPIELCWNKLKHLLRAANARCRDSLDRAIAAAMDAITPHDAVAWFRHCGYGRRVAHGSCAP